MKKKTEKGWIIQLPPAKAFHSSGDAAEEPVPAGMGMKEYPALKVVYDPSWGGLIAQGWPEQIALGLDIVSFCNENRGLVEMKGKGGIGTRLTFQLTNGNGIYEIVGSVATTHPKHPRVLVGELRALKRFPHPKKKIDLQIVRSKVN